MPTVQPGHHHMLPPELYTDTDIEWDNADQHANPGVNLQIDLFRYPWPIEDNTYDVALAAHLIEHIPHGIIRNGQLESLAGGWWAWWAEMGRVLKPGGIIYVIVPYAGSRSALSDPTHTRYIMPTTFGYFTNTSTTFDYHLAYEWDVVYGPNVTVTNVAAQEADHKGLRPDQKDEWFLRKSLHHVDVVEDFGIAMKVRK